ncbi:hypothetical protein AMELA_G00175850 [Ameiurus melas]|uniref:Uncharacterized protein n=1 Tax=Ameiurus melas TaxID=219545 RepID=A0A7J6AFP4_AMEME|nr:hypothetical protein AMELA_G00175850 [Ameiurus melas]
MFSRLDQGDSISSFAKHINPVDQMNGELQKKPLKEEEPENDEYLCKTSGGTSVSVVNVTPMEQQNGEFQEKLIKEEGPDDDYLYCEVCKSFCINQCEVHGPQLTSDHTEEKPYDCSHCGKRFSTRRDVKNKVVEKAAKMMALVRKFDKQLGVKVWNVLVCCH